VTTAETHADGANMLASALAPHKGIAMWRAFAYSDSGTDRIGQSCNEFNPPYGEFTQAFVSPQRTSACVVRAMASV